MSKSIDLVVTTALPYANGPIHLGHMIEHIQADVWVRFQKMMGRSCLFLSGDDAHGSAIMLSAQKANASPEAYIQAIYDEHVADFADFYIDFDHYHTTHSPENKQLSQDIFLRLQAAQMIEAREVAQAFDQEKQFFLPDRFVKGTCPVCKTPDQYGDNCEQCGATYVPLELLDPKSVLSNTTPISKTSSHLFFTLHKHQQNLLRWLEQTPLQPEVKNKLREWFDGGLKDWDISRDAPYFGFEIPGYPNKYFYVWLDAPIGYMASLQAYCTQHPQYRFETLWGPDSTTEITHFIGKDILYFHGLFWPAMLTSAQYKLPSTLHAHGFLTLNNQKMSKSRGTFITARRYLDQLPAEYLRYYFASKMHAGIHDIDLNWVEFQQRINSDLIGKVVNIASRCASFIHKYFEGHLGSTLDEKLMAQGIEAGTAIADFYQAKQFNLAISHIMKLADRINQYIADQAPWQKIKDPSQHKAVHEVCTTGLNGFRLLMIYLAPILPVTTQRAAQFMNDETPYLWNDIQSPLCNQSIQPYPRLMERIDDQQISTLQSDAVDS